MRYSLSRQPIILALTNKLTTSKRKKKHTTTPKLNVKIKLKQCYSNCSCYFVRHSLASAVFHFLPSCMECRRGLAMRILSVCPSVYPTNAKIVTKRQKDLSRFLYHTKEHLSEMANFRSIFARSASAVTPSEKFN